MRAMTWEGVHVPVLCMGMEYLRLRTFIISKKAATVDAIERPRQKSGPQTSQHAAAGG